MRQLAWQERLDTVSALLLPLGAIPHKRSSELSGAELPGTGDRIADQFTNHCRGQKGTQ